MDNSNMGGIIMGGIINTTLLKKKFEAQKVLVICFKLIASK